MIYKHKNTELFGYSRSYILTFESKDKEIQVGVVSDYQSNPDFEEISNIEFDEKDNLSKSQKEKIGNWIYDNFDNFKGDLE